jgi:hypothetical protein
MFRLLKLVSVLGAALGLAGCYDSELPIDPVPRLGPNPALFGSWRCLPVGGKVTDSPATMTIAPLRQREYTVVFDSDRYEAYSSAVRGKMIANLRSLAPARDGKSWSFVRYSFLRPNLLHLEIPSDRAIDEEHPPVSLRKAFEQLTESSFEDFAVCVQAAEK